MKSKFGIFAVNITLRVQTYWQKTNFQKKLSDFLIAFHEMKFHNCGILQNLHGIIQLFMINFNTENH